MQCVWRSQSMGELNLGIRKPEISTTKWLAIIMSTLLAGGGVFWAAGRADVPFNDGATNT